jgi:hypothetical protein
MTKEPQLMVRLVKGSYQPRQGSKVVAGSVECNQSGSIILWL